MLILVAGSAGISVYSGRKQTQHARMSDLSLLGFMTEKLLFEIQFTEKSVPAKRPACLTSSSGPEWPSKSAALRLA